MFGKKKKKENGAVGTGAGPASGPDGRIGRYVVERTLGQGGMGTVFLANDPVIGRKVAIKVVNIRADLPEEEAVQYRERFLREAQAAGSLVHPNIVAVFDVGQDERTRSPYIVMEHVAGHDLKHVILKQAPLPAAEAVRIASQVASALDFAHRRGIVHRDIKPANVLISERGQVKITDFGVARLPDSDLTRSDQFVGSPGFMSPEQLKGSAVDGRADLFALGVILYQLLTGRSPFEGDSVSEVLYRISTQPAEPPSEIHPDVSADFDPILEKALSKDPGRRYQSGQEMIAAMGGTAHGDEGAAPGSIPAARPKAGASPAGRLESAWWTLNSQWRLGMLVVALAAAFIGINWGIAALFHGPVGRVLMSDAPASSLPGALGSLGMIGAPQAPAASGTFCAMSYADPRELARLQTLRRNMRASGPAAPREKPGARLTLQVAHRVPAGRVVVLVDGKTVLSKPFLAHDRKATLTHTLSVPAGRHGVEVRLLGTKGEIKARARIAGILSRDRVAVLKAEQKSDARTLQLAWETTARARQ